MGAARCGLVVQTVALIRRRLSCVGMHGRNSDCALVGPLLGLGYGPDLIEALESLAVRGLSTDQATVVLQCPEHSNATPLLLHKAFLALRHGARCTCFTRNSAAIGCGGAVPARLRTRSRLHRSRCSTLGCRFRRSDCALPWQCHRNHVFLGDGSGLQERARGRGNCSRALGAPAATAKHGRRALRKRIECALSTHLSPDFCLAHMPRAPVALRRVLQRKVASCKDITWQRDVSGAEYCTLVPSLERGDTDDADFSRYVLRACPNDVWTARECAPLCPGDVAQWLAQKRGGSSATKGEMQALLDILSAMCSSDAHRFVPVWLGRVDDWDAAASLLDVEIEHIAAPPEGAIISDAARRASFRCEKFGLASRRERCRQAAPRHE